MQPGNASGLEGLGDWLKRLLESVQRWLEENSETIEGIVRKLHHHLLFEKAGWLPHHATPFADLRDEWSASELSSFLSTYYLDNWLKIREEFEKHLIAPKIDNEAKATFIEALDAHGLGLYRVAPRLLFPEIERLARKEFRAGRPGTISILDSIRDMIERKEIGMSELAPSGGGPVFAQFARMADHLYKTAGTTENVAELVTTRFQTAMPRFTVL
jgi:hypothetical protein